MKNPNGYGGISKLPGNRRKPYRVRLTAGWQYQTPLRLKSAAYHFRRALQPVV